MTFSELNLWAVLVAAAASFMVGGVWYAALFPKAWAAANRHSEEALKAMAAKQGRNFAIFFFGDLVMAGVLSALAAKLSVASAGGGAMLGVAAWLGFAATTRAAKTAANNLPLAAYLIDTGHELVCLLVMGVIIGAWR